MVKKLFIFLVSSIPVTALAGFQIVEETPKSAPTAGVVSSPASVQSTKNSGGMQLVALTYIGGPDVDIPVIYGFGRDLKLSEAIKQIVPAGWHAFLKEGMATRVGKFGPVNWKGGRRWIEVLDIFANDQSLAIDVDWTKKHLYVGEKNFVASTVKVAGPPQAPAQVIWLAKSGSFLRDTLGEWSLKSGWSLVWGLSDEEDFRLETGNSYPGDFKKAVFDLIESLPLTVRIRVELRPDNTPPLLYVIREEGVRQ